MMVDPESKSIITHIVYDGLENVGKTTNLQQLSQFIKDKPKQQIYSPNEVNGRTLYFDMLVVLSDQLIEGYSLRYHFLTVPDQLLLTRRRSFLLELADVVVFVCESTPEGLQHAGYGFRLLREYMQRKTAHHMSLLVQANKQDLPDALSPVEALAQLGLEPEIPVVGATTKDGKGVRETAMMAAQLALSRVKTLIAESKEHQIGVEEAFAGKLITGEDLLRGMVEHETKTPFWSMNSCLVDTLLRESGEIAAERKPSLPLPQVPPAAPPTKATPDTAIKPKKSPTPIFTSKVDATKLPGAPNLPGAAPNPKQSSPVPPMYDSALSSVIWPAEKGCLLLQQLTAERAPMEAKRQEAPATGKDHTILYLTERWCFKTSRLRCFSDHDEAHNALVLLARIKAKLGSLLLPQTTLALHPEGERYWLWTISPRVVTLQTLMQEAAKANDESALGRCLASFAAGIAEALRLASRREAIIDIHPSNFAVHNEQLVYIDDELTNSLSGLFHTIVHRIEKYMAFSHAIDVYLLALEKAFLSKLSQNDLHRTKLKESLEEITPRNAKADEVRHHLLNVMSRCKTKLERVR